MKNTPSENSARTKIVRANRALRVWAVARRDLTQECKDAKEDPVLKRDLFAPDRPTAEVGAGTHDLSKIFIWKHVRARRAISFVQSEYRYETTNGRLILEARVSELIRRRCFSGVFSVQRGS